MSSEAQDKATGQFPNTGIPSEAAEGDSKARPASDRGATETAAARTEEKHGE